MTASLGRNKQFLFVYGSLLSTARGNMGARQRRFLRWHARRIGWATTAGRIYDLGGYPGLRRSQISRPAAQGELWAIVDGRRLWPVLDAYEGLSDEPPVYVRTVAPVVRCDGRRDMAWLYEWTGERPARPADTQAPNRAADGCGQAPLTIHVTGRWRG